MIFGNEMRIFLIYRPNKNKSTYFLTLDAHSVESSGKFRVYSLLARLQYVKSCKIGGVFVVREWFFENSLM